MPILDRNDREAAERFDRFVAGSPWGSATQDVRWAHVKAGWESGQAYLERGGEIAAALCVIFKDVGPGVLAYAPRGPVCDPRDTALVQALAEEAAPLMKARGAFALRMDPAVPYDEALCESYEKLGFRSRARGYNKHQLIQPRWNMVLPLEGKSWEELMASFGEKTRYNIRLAQRKGVTVRWSHSPADVDLFYEIYKVTCERDRIGSRPRDYFQRMLEAYGGEMMRVYVAEHEGRPLSAALALNYGREVFYIYGASSNEDRNLMPTYAMQAAMIGWALELGKAYYDFGGVFELDKANGLYRFKEGFCHSVGPTEFIGEFDRVYRPGAYRIFTDVMPFAQGLRAKFLARRK